MNSLRALQIVLVLLALFGFWYANRWYQEAEMTRRVLLTVACSAAALIFTQVLPLIWLTLDGTTGIGTVTRLECPNGQKHYVYFEFPVGLQSVAGGELDTNAHACRDLHVGSVGTVIFIADAPEVHAWGGVRGQLSDMLGMMLFAALAAPGAAYISIRKWRKNGI